MTARTGSVALPSTYFSTRLLSAQPIRNVLREIGQWLVFMAQTFWYLPLTIRRYRRQTLREMNNLAWGRGSDHRRRRRDKRICDPRCRDRRLLAVEAFSTLNIVGFGALSGLTGGVGAVRIDRANSDRYRVRLTGGVPDDCRDRYDAHRGRD